MAQSNNKPQPNPYLGITFVTVLVGIVILVAYTAPNGYALLALIAVIFIYWFVSRVARM